MKKVRYATKKAAKEIIEAEKKEDRLFWLSGDSRMRDMYNMLRNSMGFGAAETRFMLAALVTAGAKFIIE